VSPIKTKRTTDGMAALGTRAKGRAQGAAARVVPLGKRAGTTAVRGVRKGVHDARGWAAPRLEDAADAVTASVAPKVSSALRSTARQVRPGDTRSPAKAGIRKLLNWRWLLAIGATLAAAGTTAAVTMRRRYASATAAAEDATLASDDKPTARDPEPTPGSTARSEVNGRVTTPGR
jgi:hypothetical protein